MQKGQDGKNMYLSRIIKKQANYVKENVTTAESNYEEFKIIDC